MQNQTTFSSLLSRFISLLTSRSTSPSDSPSDSHITTRYTKKNLPWAAFGVVLLVHVVVLWWVMGVYFGRTQDDAAQPIFVTLVVDEGPASDSSSDSSPPTFTEQSEAVASDVNKPAVNTAVAPDVNKPAVNTAEPLSELPSEPPAELAPQQSADIAEERPAKQLQDPPAAPKRTEPTARPQPVSPAPSVMPLKPKPPVSEPSGSGSAVGSASNVSGEKPAAGAPGPRVVTRIEYLGDSPRPVYPTLARSRKQQGKVIVRVLISPEGLISSINVQQSSGFESLDDAAMRAFAPIRFKPYSENGVPLERIADIPIEFLLRN